MQLFALNKFDKLNNNNFIEVLFKKYVISKTVLLHYFAKLAFYVNYSLQIVRGGE